MQRLRASQKAAEAAGPNQGHKGGWEDALQSPFLPIEILLWFLRLHHTVGWGEESTGPFHIRESRIPWNTSSMRTSLPPRLESGTQKNNSAHKTVPSLPPFNGSQCQQQCWRGRSQEGPNCSDPAGRGNGLRTENKRLLHGSVGIDSFSSFHILDLGWIHMLHGLHLKQAS